MRREEANRLSNRTGRFENWPKIRQQKEAWNPSVPNCNAMMFQQEPSQEADSPGRVVSNTRIVADLSVEGQAGPGICH